MWRKNEEKWCNQNVHILYQIEKNHQKILMNFLNNNRQLNGEWFSCLLLFCHIKGELPILWVIGQNVLMANPIL